MIGFALGLAFGVAFYLYVAAVRFLGRDRWNRAGDPATCCGCGTASPVAAVWGPEGSGAEGYCYDCYSTAGVRSPGFLPGCTVARIRAGLTWEQYEVATDQARAFRVPVAYWLLRT